MPPVPLRIAELIVLKLLALTGGMQGRFVFFQRSPVPLAQDRRRVVRALGEF